ncbi:MAG: hypothetical protein RBR38_16760 [Desulfomicrobium apsheronum]|nr:hypothetical protein [Desulfomicrobium apsheronum]
MKEENLKKAQEIISALEAKRIQLEYLQDSRSVASVSLRVNYKGSAGINKIAEHSTMAIKAILIVDVKKSIFDLESKLAGL